MRMTKVDLLLDVTLALVEAERQELIRRYDAATPHGLGKGRVPDEEKVARVLVDEIRRRLGDAMQAMVRARDYTCTAEDLSEMDGL